MNFGKIVEVTEIMKGCPREHIVDTLETIPVYLYIQLEESDST
jgi:hypothetical protein